jgi:hypothetical protein
MLADGGWWQQVAFTDDTSGSTNAYTCDSADVRNAFAGDHTVTYVGYYSSTGPDPTGWAASISGTGIDGGATQFQLRRGGGNNLQAVETPNNVASSGGECIDNYCAMMARRTSDGGLTVQQGGNVSNPVLSTMGALQASALLYIGSGGCTGCQPAGASGGPVVQLNIYDEAKTDSWFQAHTRALESAGALASGGGTQVGNLGVRRARYDLDKPGGWLPVFGVGEYLMDPLTGSITNQTFHVLGPADSLDAGSLVGSATWRSKFDKGPFYNWKHQNTAGVLSSEDGGIAGEVLGSINGDGGIINTNAYFIGTAFTDAGYTVSGTYWIQNICTGGTIDGGFDHCTGSVSGSGAFAAYPRYGCPMVCAGATGAVKSVLYVGNDAGQTAALEIGHRQMTDALAWQDPLPTNAQVSAQWLEVDAGSYLPQGCTAGKICVVYQMQFSSSWYPSTLNSTQPPGEFSYLYDISNPATGATHDMLQWPTTEIQSDGGTIPTLDGLMYGDDPNYITPNKFSSGGQYSGAPNSNTTGTYYITCLAWDVETGTLPDGGVGQGSRLIETANVCADQTQPYACTDSVIVNQNTGQLGLCAGSPTVFEIGTRAGGTGPSTTRDHHFSICSCSGAKCQGPCI